MSTRYAATRARRPRTIGFILASVMFVFLALMNSCSPITGITCLVCLTFLFFESAFGICLGCMFYPLFFGEKARHCPGETCDVRVRQDIQKTSKVQLVILCGFVVYVLLAVVLLNGSFSANPYDLFGIYSTTQTK